MKNTLPIGALALVLGTGALAGAQTVGQASPATGQVRNYEADHDDDQDWGWIGLLGLAGLAGLKRRPTEVREVRTTSTPDVRTTTPR